MSEKDGISKELGTELVEGNANTIERMQDWLANPEAYFQEMEKAEILIDRLLKEREALLGYIKALRFWAYEVIGGCVNMNDQPADMHLLEAMMNLPDYLRKEIQSNE